MTLESLLSVLSEITIFSLIHNYLTSKWINYLVVTLWSHPMQPVWMHDSWIYSMHFRFTDMLYDDWDTEFPNKKLLIVWTRHKLSIVIEECYCIDSRVMFFILLAYMNEFLLELYARCWHQIAWSSYLKSQLKIGSTWLGLGWSSRIEGKI